MNSAAAWSSNPERPGGALANQWHAILSSLFDERVAVACSATSLTHPYRSAPPAEGEPNSLPSSASASRLAEFRAGRACARRALRALGEREVAVPRGARGEPLWPAAIVGSISHGDGFCAVVAARRTDYAGLGVDVEADAPVSTAFARRVCSPAELANCAELSEPDVLARVVFSAKESVYKLQYPLTHAVLYWREIELTLSAPHEQGGIQRGQFHARLLGAPGPLGNACLNGHWLRGAGLILTGISLETFAIKTV